MRIRAAMMALAVVVLSTLAAADEPDPQHRWTDDDDGRSFRTGFDPGRRFVLGGGFGPRFDLAGDRSLDTGYLEVGVHYRHEIDFEEELIVWKLYHEALLGRVELGHSLGPRLVATAYRGRLVRWAEDGRLVLPTNPPKHIPFPFNIGVETTVGRIDYREIPRGFSADIGVLRSEVLIDLWQRRRMRSYAQLGVGPRYDLWWLSREPQDAAAIHHLVAPFSGGSFSVHHETADGHHTLDAQLATAYRLRVDHGWSPLVAASASYEAVLIAINDLPVSSYVSADYQFTGDPAANRSEHELRGSAGLRLGIPFDR